MDPNKPVTNVAPKTPDVGAGAPPPPAVVAFLGMPVDPATAVGAAVANVFAFFCTPVGQTSAKHIYEGGLEVEKWLEGTLGKVGNFFEGLGK